MSIEEIKASLSKSNPFNFPRPSDSEDTGTMYRTNGEMYGLLKSQLELEKTLKLPDIILPTAGKGIVIKESWDIKFSKIEFCYEGKSRIPKSIMLICENDSIALLIRRNKNKNDEDYIDHNEDGRLNDIHCMFEDYFSDIILSKWDYMCGEYVYIDINI